ncbi:MAG: hypothetical protein HN337_04370 [Deltaproteobacteria bacterium]|nr:hypothetical protein [Deltaproteobacteria bacterium]
MTGKQSTVNPANQPNLLMELYINLQEKLAPGTCGVGNKGRRYKTIVANIGNETAYNIIPNDLFVGDYLNPTPLQLLRHKFNYGTFNACYYPDPLNSGASAYFLEVEGKLGKGGREEPYAVDMPKCSSRQILGRVYTFLDGSGEIQPGLAHPSALWSPFWEDPSEQSIIWLSDYMVDVGAIGMCQKTLSNDSYKHGLFFYFNEDPLAELDAKPAGCGDFMDVFPPDIRSCKEASEKIEDEYLQLINSSAQYQTMFEKSMQDDCIRTEKAPNLTAELMQIIPFMNLSDHNIAVFEDIVAFALENDISEDEVLFVAEHSINGVNCMDDYLHKVRTVIALKVAKKLHQRNITNGGISKDFETFSDTISQAILDGKISVRTKKTSEYVTMNGAFAFYSPIDNEIAYPPIDTSLSTVSMFEALIHECRHAFHDYKGEAMTKLNDEMKAYSAGAKASTLLAEFNGTTSAEVQVYAMENRRIMLRFALEKMIGYQACIGIPRKTIITNMIMQDEAIKLEEQWRQAIHKEVVGLSDGSSKQLFKRMYAFRNLLYMQGGLLDSAFAFIPQAIKEGTLSFNDEAGLNNFLSPQTSRALSDRILQSPDGSYTKSAAANQYLQYLYNAFVLARYLKPGNVDRLFDDFNRHSTEIGTALLYQGSSYDGL